MDLTPFHFLTKRKPLGSNSKTDLFVFLLCEPGTMTIVVYLTETTLENVLPAGHGGLLSDLKLIH